jgi:glycosyltransferase involved in cell wall biosynthesis
MTRRALMFAFPFPPFSQSTGRLRTLAFARDLPAHGWTPVVVTARETAYPEIDRATLAEIPSGTQVIRAFGADVARVASIRGIYPRWLATPDRWNTWILGCVAAAKAAVRQQRIDALWATFPIPSALVAALRVHRLTGLPFIADLRDPIVYDTWPVNRWDRKVYARIEAGVVRNASAVVVTTPSAARMYRDRYPDRADLFHVIPNGMEDSDVRVAESRPPGASDTAALTLLHGGLMEVPDRDPSALFQALRMLKEQGLFREQGLRVILRGSGNEQRFAEAARAAGVADIVEILSRIPREQALKEMATVTGLLLFQGQHCNRQIPAKAYEYLAFGKPIVALMDGAGDTHSLVHGEWRVPYCADMENPDGIAATLAQFMADARAGRLYVPPADLRESYTRKAQSVRLAALLDSVTQQASAHRPKV